MFVFRPVLFFLLFFLVLFPSVSFSACEGAQPDGSCSIYLWSWNHVVYGVPGDTCRGLVSTIDLDASCTIVSTSPRTCPPFDMGVYHVTRYVYSGGSWSSSVTWNGGDAVVGATPSFGLEGTAGDLPSGGCCDVEALLMCGAGNITWDDRSDCKYHCSDGGCEQEYLSRFSFSGGGGERYFSCFYIPLILSFFSFSRYSFLF